MLNKAIFLKFGFEMQCAAKFKYISMEEFKMASRLVISVEFSKGKPEDLQLYAKLKEFSAPGATIKDILKGNLPLSILKTDEDNSR